MPIFFCISLLFVQFSELKQCVEAGLLPSSIFDYPFYLNREDPTAVGITKFVLDNVKDAKPLTVKRMTTLFKGFGYHNLASSMTGEGLSVAVTFFLS